MRQILVFQREAGRAEDFHVQQTLLVVPSSKQIVLREIGGQVSNRGRVWISYELGQEVAQVKREEFPVGGGMVGLS